MILAVDPGDVADRLSAGGTQAVIYILVVLVLLVTVGVFRGWWVAGPFHRQAIADLKDAHAKQIVQLERDAERQVAIRDRQLDKTDALAAALQARIDELQAFVRETLVEHQDEILAKQIDLIRAQAGLPRDVAGGR